MNNDTIVQTQTTSPNGVRTRRVGIRPTPRPSLQLISDGVVASYIHEISERHHPHDQEPNWAPRPAVLSPCGG
jgi:hypothetical protein